MTMSDRTFIMRPGTGIDGKLTRIAAFSIDKHCCAFVKTEDGDYIGTALSNVYINDPAGYRQMTMTEAKQYAVDSVA